jgi:tight adherence protein B
MDLLALAAALTVLFAVVFVALAVYSGAAAGVAARSRLEGVLAGTSVVEGEALVALRRAPIVAGFLRGIVSGSWLERIERELQRADSKLQPMDYIALRVLLAGVGFVGPFLYFSNSMGTVTGFVLGLIGGAIGFFLPMWWISNRRQSRNRKLEEQLPETLSLVSNSLKAGFGLLQSLDLAADQMDHPVATELKTAIHEMNVGSSVEEALIALNERTESYDLDLVVTAILVQRSVGGNLSEILETVAATMRERIRIRGEIKTLTAQQTLTGIIIGLLPVAVGSLFMVISPEYMTVLFTENAGRIALGVAVVLESIGLIIIKRILAIEV